MPLRSPSSPSSFSRWLVVGALLMPSALWPSLALAQPRAGHAAPANSALRGSSYVLGPGDVLRISVFGMPELDIASVVVPPDGVVTLARYGTVHLGGRSVASAQAALRQALIARARLRDPQIALEVTAPRPARVTVSGDVPRSGAFDVRPGERLSALLAEIGLTDRLEEKRASLVRAGRTLSLDLPGAALSPGSAADIALLPGDFLAVKSLTPAKVTIQGDVDRPGPYELHRRPRAEANELPLEPRLTDLLAKAGWRRGASSGAATSTTTSPNDATGANSTSAPSSPSLNFKATLQRGAEKRALDLGAALDNVAGPANIALLPGDVVTISAIAPITVYLDGSNLVGRPGSFSLAPGTTVLQLLAQAGGLTRGTEDVIASVRRGDQTLPLDLNALFLSGSSSDNLALQNGDTVQLRSPDTLEVLVSGQVNKPGVVALRPGATIFEAVTQAGGLAVPTNEAVVRVLRKETDGSQRVIAADATAILTLSNVSTNAVLQRGDVVNVAKAAEATVFINGEVTTPNAYTLREGEGITQLLTRAGGPKDFALLSRVSVTRGAKVLTVDAYDAVKKNQPLDFPLQDGDQVLVPRNPNAVAVIEAVSKPGLYPIPERGQLTLTDALLQAAPVVGTREVFIGHRNADGTYSTDNKAIKLDDLRRGRVPNPVLKPGDVVFVPSPKGPKRDLLGVLGSIATLRFFF